MRPNRDASYTTNTGTHYSKLYYIWLGIFLYVLFSTLLVYRVVLSCCCAILQAFLLLMCKDPMPLGCWSRIMGPALVYIFGCMSKRKAEKRVNEISFVASYYLLPLLCWSSPARIGHLLLLLYQLWNCVKVSITWNCERSPPPPKCHLGRRRNPPFFLLCDSVALLYIWQIYVVRSILLGIDMFIVLTCADSLLR